MQNEHLTLTEEIRKSILPKTGVILQLISIKGFILTHLKQRKSKSSPSRAFFPISTTLNFSFIKRIAQFSKNVIIIVTYNKLFSKSKSPSSQLTYTIKEKIYII